MNRRPLAKCILRLFALCIMFGGLMILTSSQRVAAEGCDTAYGDCIYNCTNLQGRPYEQCQPECDRAYEMCRLNGGETSPSGGGPPPMKWPVIDRSRSICLQGCQQGASQIADGAERLEYYMACWNYCNDTYPKP